MGNFYNVPPANLIDIQRGAVGLGEEQAEKSPTTNQESNVCVREEPGLQ